MHQVFEPQPKKSKKKNSKGEFPCFDCEYVATRAYHLKTHVESKHEGVRYPCLQCEYAAMLKINMQGLGILVLTVIILQLQQVN